MRQHPPGSANRFNRWSRFVAAIAFLFMAAGWAGGHDARAEEPEIFGNIGGIEIRGDSATVATVGVGAFNIFPDGGGDDTSAIFLGEIRIGEKLWFFGPAVGVTVNTDGGVYGYAGIYSDFAMGNFILTPFSGIGAYSKGNSKDLGGTFEIRTSLELSYEFANRQRVGLMIAHLSNAHINDENPGEEEVLVTYSLPLGN